MRSDIEDDISDEDEGQSPFDIQEVVLFGILRSRVLVLACGLFGVAGGLLWGASQPNTYRSDAKLLLRIGQREQLNIEGLIDNPGARENRPTIEDELHLLRDDRILREVVAELGADYILAPPDPGRFDSDATPLHVQVMHQLQSLLIQLRGGGSGGGVSDGTSLEQTAVEVLKRSTFLRPEFGSNVISVSHTTTSPDKAKRIVDALVDAYIRRHRDHFSVGERIAPMRAKLEMAENRVEKARTALTEHVSDCNLINIEVQGEAWLTEQATLESDIFSSRTQLAENRQRLAVIDEQLKVTPPRIEVAVGENIPNPEYEAIRAEYQSVQEMRQALTTDASLTMAERLRREAEYDTRQQKLLERLNSTQRTIPSVQPEERDNPRYAFLQQQKTELEINDRALGTRIQLYQNQLQAVGERIKVLRVCTDLHARMQVSIAHEQDAYDEMKSRFNRYEVLNEIDQQGEANLSALQRGNLPTDKEGPSRGKMLIAGIIGGTGLGVGLALLRQLTERLLRYPRGAARALGLPNLVVVPELRSARGLKREVLGRGQ